MVPLTILTLLLAIGFSPAAPRANASDHSDDPRELVVFAAASLSQAFREIAGNLQASNPGCKVVFNFAGSQQLVQQIAQGAAFDVVATANTKHMDAAVRMGSVDSASVQTFTLNHLVILFDKVPGVHLASIADLATPKLKIVLADRSVPVGQYAIDFLNKCSSRKEFGPDFTATVMNNVISYEENVKAVVSKVLLGEADAGIAYSSDAATLEDEHVGTIAIPESLNILAEYPIACAKETRNRDLAEKFIQYVLSEEGQALLTRFGFTRAKVPAAKR